MNSTCGHGAEETCDVCRVADQLRAHEPELDDVMRARVLARMSPELDAIARRYGDREAPRRWWLPIAGVAAVAAAFGLWLGHRSKPEHVPVAHVERSLLAPYVVAGPVAPEVATTLLAGRFATLDVKAGQLVRATVDGDRDARVAVVGPSKLTAGPAVLELDAGTVLVDARHPVHLRAGGADIQAQAALFGVSVVDHATVVFVDHGVLTLDGRSLGAGWYGPEALRSQALVTAVRDHGNAIAPPDNGGIAAITGDTQVATGSGAVLGTPPLWARLPAGDNVIVARDQRTPVAIEEGGVHHVATQVVEPAPHIATPIVTGPTASQLYASAEAALRAGDRGTAEARWNELVLRFPSSSQAASALYDLAGLARARSDYSTAQALLAKLPPTAPAALREPSAYLRCRLRVDAGEPVVAADCFRTFRSQFASSAHDAEVLAWLTGYAQTTSCAAARELADEYLRRYPNGSFAARARECASTP